MKTGDVQMFIAISGFLAGVGSTLLAALRWYANGQKKAYAAERDFEHLRRNQEQMKESIRLMFDQLDEVHDDVRTQTAVFNVLIAQTGQSVSGILGYKKRDEG